MLGGARAYPQSRLDLRLGTIRQFLFHFSVITIRQSVFDFSDITIRQSVFDFSDITIRQSHLDFSGSVGITRSGRCAACCQPTSHATPLVCARHPEARAQALPCTISNLSTTSMLRVRTRFRAAPTCEVGAY